MSRGAWWVALVPAAALAAGCAVGLGEACSDELPCPQVLTCARPPLRDGGAAPVGYCDYPLRVEGEPCTRAAECQSALTCSNHFAPGSRYGTCVPRRGAGEACFVPRDCVSNRCQGGSGRSLDGVCG